MKWTVEGDHRRHFEEHGYVGFEEIISLEQREAALEEAAEGHDLWRRSEAFKAITTSRRIAGLVAELTGVTRVRLAYDQISAEGPLAQKGSVQGVLCGLIIDLYAGTGMFISPDHFFITDDFLIVYARDPALYVYNPLDSHTSQWKRLGLTYGDQLRDPLFPLLAR